MTTESSSDKQPPSRSSDSSDSFSTSLPASPLALICATAVSLASMAAVLCLCLRDQRAPWWAGPAGVVIAALPTSVRAAVVRSVVSRVLPTKK